MPDLSYATTLTDIESVLLHTLPNFGSELGDGILNTNNTTALLKAKGAYERVDGGLEAWEGVIANESSNAKWQGMNDDFSVNAQDPSKRMYWAWKVFTNSVTMNNLELAMNRGRALVKQYLLTKRQQAESTTRNKFNGALWAASPASTEPESIPSIISATPTTGTIGGLSRSTSSALQNGAYTTAITDISSDAGLGNIYELCAKYASGQDLVDCVILPVALYGAVLGYLGGKNQYRPSDITATVGFKPENYIQLGSITIGYENTTVKGGHNTITSTYMYGINSKYFKIKQLNDPSVGKNGWTSDFERVGQKMVKAVYYQWFGAMTTNAPCAHFVATSVAST